MKVITFLKWTAELERKYEELVENSYKYNVQQGLLWYHSYQKYFVKNQDVIFVSILEADQMIGCFPLEIGYRKGTRYWKLRTFYPLGIKKIDFYSLLIRKGYKDEVLEFFFKWLKENSNLWEDIHLMKIPESAISIQDLNLGNQKADFEITFSRSRVFYKVDTTQKWETYFEGFFKRKNKDLLKDLRSLEKKNISLRVERITDNIAGHFNEVMEIYKQRRISLGQENKYEDENVLAFLKSVLIKFEKRGMAEISLLKDQDSEIWAFQLDWVKDKIRYHYHHAYNESFKKYSPGKILLYMLMKESFEDPEIIECNHMFGDSVYKSRLAEESECYISFKIKNDLSLRNKGLQIAYKISGIRDKIFR